MSTRFIESTAVTQYIQHDSIVNRGDVVARDFVLQVDSDALAGEQTIHLHSAEVEDPRGVIIAPVSWSDYGKRGFQQNRLGTMARFANATVIGLDFPGMGDLKGGRRDELTEKQLEELEGGRMQDLAAKYWQALDESSLLNDANGIALPIALWGHSLSTLTTAELAAALPDGRVLSDMYNSEVMALSETTVGHLMRIFPTKGAKDLTSVYQKMNVGAPEVESSGGNTAFVRQIFTQRQSHLGSAKALAAGRHTEIIEEAYKSGRLNNDPEHGTLYTLVQAEHGLAKFGDYQKFERKLVSANRRAVGLVNPRTLLGEFHGYQDSLPALICEMSRLALLAE